MGLIRTDPKKGVELPIDSLDFYKFSVPGDEAGKRTLIETLEGKYVIIQNPHSNGFLGIHSSLGVIGSGEDGHFNFYRGMERDPKFDFYYLEGVILVPSPPIALPYSSYGK